MGGAARSLACIAMFAACRSNSAPPDTTSFGSDATRTILIGTIVTPDAIIDGEVLIHANTIECVDVGAACQGLAVAAGATVIDTHGIIAPGLIDTHNHILFDIFDND